MRRVARVELKIDPKAISYEELTEVELMGEVEEEIKEILSRGMRGRGSSVIQTADYIEMDEFCPKCEGTHLKEVYDTKCSPMVHRHYCYECENEWVA